MNKAIAKGKTMHFTSETSSNGVIERNFILDEITGVLWSPTSGTVGSPLLLAGHSGGMHKKAPGLVASALHSVTTYGFTVAAIDAPGHGDRPRNLQDQQWAEAIHQARAADEPIAPIVIDYNMSLAERAVPEWQATLDAVLTSELASSVAYVWRRPCTRAPGTGCASGPACLNARLTRDWRIPRVIRSPSRPTNSGARAGQCDRGEPAASVFRFAVPGKRIARLPRYASMTHC